MKQQKQKDIIQQLQTEEMKQKVNFSSLSTKPGFQEGAQKAQSSRKKFRINIFKWIFNFVWTHIETQQREANAFKNSIDSGYTNEIQKIQQTDISPLESSHGAMIMQNQNTILWSIFTIIIIAWNTIKEKTVKIYSVMKKSFVQDGNQSNQNKTQSQKSIETENRGNKEQKSSHLELIPEVLKKLHTLQQRINEMNSKKQAIKVSSSGNFGISNVYNFVSPINSHNKLSSEQALKTKENVEEKGTTKLQVEVCRFGKQYVDDNERYTITKKVDQIFEHQDIIPTQNTQQTHNSSQIPVKNDNIEQTVTNTTNLQKNLNENIEIKDEKNQMESKVLIKEDDDRKSEKIQEKNDKSQIKNAKRIKETHEQKKVQQAQAQLGQKDSLQEKNIQQIEDCQNISNQRWIREWLCKMNNNSFLSRQLLLIMIQKIKNNSNNSKNKLSIQQVNQLILNCLLFIVEHLKKSQSEVVNIEIYQHNGKGLSIQETEIKKNSQCCLVQDCSQVQPIGQSSNSPQKKQKILARIRYLNNDRKVQLPPIVQSSKDLNRSISGNILLKKTESLQTSNFNPRDPEQDSNSNLFEISEISFQNSIMMDIEWNGDSNSKLLKTQEKYPDILKGINLLQNSIEVQSSIAQLTNSLVGSSNASQSNDLTPISNQSFQKADQSSFQSQSLIQTVIHNNQTLNPYVTFEQTSIQNIVEVDTKCITSDFYVQIKAISRRQISEYEKFQQITSTIQVENGQDLLVTKDCKRKRHNSHQLQLTYVFTKIVYVGEKSR